MVPSSQLRFVPQEHYDAEAARVQQRAPPMPQGNPAVLMDVVVSRVETRLQSTGHVCAAELYCCCSPCFVLCMLLMPVYLFLNLVVWIGLIRGPCIGCNAGCGLSCAEFSKRLCEAIKTIDILSSLAAFGTPNPWCEYSRPVQATQIQQPIAYATY
ncbi:hypothetical protein CTAYLR_005282 [Chrysophaeum taylorii]|uniref:Uncharacterized protein n=1 Tax=Chrysophaeum taylorii TaxID=2483200 RepID=A0AAD7XS69_9STRA|nr:hypothetical protein CTAYLR_005282 [Chrysophaeum taylorii]